MTKSVEAIVVGAGPAGLASASALKARGRDAVILERSDAVASVWRRHYDRLHLHTDRARSSLLGLTMPTAYGRYPSRAQVIEYLEAYAAKFALEPVFNAMVRAIRRDGSLWRAEAGAQTYVAPIAVVATGLADFPYSPSWPGMQDFVGQILHSSVYRNPAPFTGKRILVVGYGNSGAEIALDLSEADVDVALAVRSPVNVVPREVFGRPILAWGLAGRLFPARVADSINAPLLRFTVGSIDKLGLKRSPKGPLQSIEEDGATPSTSGPSMRFATDESSFAAISQASPAIAWFSGSRPPSDRRRHPRDRVPPRPPPAAARRQGRSERRRRAARQRRSDGRARTLLLWRRTLRPGTIAADRHRCDPDRYRRAVAAPGVSAFSLTALTARAARALSGRSRRSVRAQ